METPAGLPVQLSGLLAYARRACCVTDSPIFTLFIILYKLASAVTDQSRLFQRISYIHSK
jgi:hypothetical protein